ncbi:MAG: Hpt domain-containing protein [Candidatus Latescibacteria bacterium]|nr:Hpt domain-containing protein [Candidatus Latescibacterota bacterium]
MDESPDALNDQLKALYEAYAAHLPDKLSQIEAAWQALQHNAGASDPLNTLYFLVHKLTGSGATFGLTTVSEAASRLEQYLQTLIEGPAPPTPEQLAQISVYLEPLKQAAGRCTSGGTSL